MTVAWTSVYDLMCHQITFVLGLIEVSSGRIAVVREFQCLSNCESSIAYLQDGCGGSEDGARDNEIHWLAVGDQGEKNDPVLSRPETCSVVR
ncbi:hypothetical protein PHSY_006896 [Pseudozyma hubeiensis SY62]|uniref:Uncharacterized protein n=1 Tax=Pseudozyma hubeiensis (strain SY62) TaxID=1305764 RepID=R9PMG8_PSEHS|nr:hypothetical protein PHSY_006896 [Pseudozyma hubeiensis SY62]GAC99295.1 hypothetical protein PHSY_006896 [Pseudozyma hubeiensis SY62]